MNESPGGTPNPLNPSPNGQPMPTNSVPQANMAPRIFRNSRMSPRPIQEVGSRRSINVTGATTGGRLGTDSAATGTTPADAEASMNTMIQSLDPTGRPMEQAPVFVDKPQKKKTGLIVAISALAVLLIGGGVAAAVILLTMNSNDAVSKAMDKIMSGSTPSNVAIDGSIEMRPNDESSVVQSVKIDLDSNLVRNSMVNESSAVVTLSIANMDDISLSFNEVYADSGDLYLKIDGVSNALQGSGLLNMLGGSPAQALQTTDLSECETNSDGEQLQCETVAEENVEGIQPIEPQANCADDPSGMTNCGPATVTPENNPLSDVLGVVSTIEGQWLRISTAELGAMMSSGMMPGSDVSCVTGLVSKINTGSSSASEAYNENPFVISSTEGLTINKKNDPLYKLSIDSEKFANFVNSMNNSELASDVYSCLGMQDNVSMTASDVEEIVSEFPEIYAEVNGDYNFTRLYVEGSGEKTNMTTIIDLSFNYPDSVNVNAPNEYQDLTTILQPLLSGMFTMPTDNTVIEDGESVVVEGGDTGVVDGEIVEEQPMP